jgi:RHS repeat-associated protein
VQADSTLTAIKDPDSVSTTFGYDGARRLQSITDRNGKTATLAYLVINTKETNKISTITPPSIPVFGGGSASPVTTLSPWQVKGVPYAATNITPFTAPMTDSAYARVVEPGSLAATRFTVNRWGAPAVTTDTLGRRTTVTYTANGQPARIVLPGYTGTSADTMAYNGSGLISFSKPAGASGTTITYGGWAQPTDVTGPKQASIHYTLGTNGRVSSVSVGGTTVQSVTYDSYGRVLRVTDGNGNIAATGYATTGSLRNRVVDSLPGPRLTNYGYDTYGRRITVQPPSGPVQTTYYSTIGFVDSVKIATTPVTVTKLAHTKLGVDTAVTDPKGQVYKYVYNDAGWLIKQVDPAGGKDTLQYDVNGDLRRRTNRRGQSIDFAYDKIHRVTSQTGSNVLTWTYPSNDTMLVAVSPAATDTVWTHLWSDSSQVKTKTVLNSQGFVRDHYFTGAGRLDSVRVTGPGGITFTNRDYAYNPVKGYLERIKLNGSETMIYRDANFNPTTISMPGGVTLGTQQGSVGAVKDTTEAVNNSYFEQWIGINGLGQIDRVVQNVTRHGRWFEYDALGQLQKGRNMMRNPEFGIPGGCPTNDFGMATTICTPSDEYVPLDSTMYSYDAVGNRTDNGGTYATGNRMTAFGSCAYTTDADGNVTSRSGGSCAGAASFFWTAEGQLDSVQVTGTGTGIKYRYDGFGRLVQKRVNGTSSSYFLWDGDNLLAELDGAASAMRAEYSYYDLDQPHALIKTGTRYYARPDALGNVLGLTDTTQTVQATYDYDDWGLLTSSSDGASFNGTDRARWKGALWMGPELDLYYMRNRWYDPATGRFLSEDPIGLDGGIDPSPYAANDPVNRSDPAGEDWCLVGWSYLGTPENRVSGYTVFGCYDDEDAVFGGPSGYPGVTDREIRPPQRSQTPPPKAKDEKACRDAKLVLAGSLALDAAFFASGGLEGILQVGKAGGYALKGLLRTVPRTGKLEYMWALNGLMRGTGTLGKAYVGTRGVGVATAAALNVVPGAAEGNFSVGSFIEGMIPLLGSWEAYKAMKAACGP